MNQSGKPYRRFVTLISLGMAVTVLLLWLMIVGEARGKRTDIEYEAFRISAAVQESLRIDSTYKPDNPSIVGYGIYNLEGVALIRDGTAPLSVDISSEKPNLVMPGNEGHNGSLIVFRPLGQPNGRGMGMGVAKRPGRNRQGGSAMLQGMMPGADVAAANRRTGNNAPAPDLLALEPHFMWLEYSRGILDRQLGFLYGGALIVTILLAGLYVSLLRLYRHTENLRQKELDSRELVQLGEAARTLVHEIKNPLGIIRIQAATLKKIGNERVADSAGVIEDEVMRLAGLADRIRDFLRSGAGEVRSFEIVPWLETYAARYNPDESVKGGTGILLSTHAGTHSVSIDPARLMQALDNLVANAFDAREAMDRSGGVEPGADPGEENIAKSMWLPEIHVEKRGSMLELSVLDRGAGIPGQDRERLFEPFFTTKAKGSGIGLALARKIARSAGGDLVFSEREGGGARFTLSLPAHTGQTR